MTTAVECKLIREGGTRAEAYGTEYHFAPYTDGAHVAVIENDEHADVFLGIREGYRLYRGNGQPVGPEAVEAPAAPVVEAETEDKADAEPEAGHDDLASLRVEYEALYGKKAHHNTGAEKLRELIAAKQ